MNTVFPFGCDASTVFYLLLYLLTLVGHAVFMSYVLAGTLYLAWANLMPGAGVPRIRQPLAIVLRDWLPFMLSAAITAGVAPLLFVQIIYRPHFYTANLLLSWRWMVVIPVLTAGFYLLYVVKNRTVADWSLARRAVLGAGTAACFLFIAFCWTANHLLSIDQAQWPDAYASVRFVASPADLILRLSTWIAGTFPVMSVLAGWQLTYYRKWRQTDAVLCDADFRRLATLSLAALLISGLTAAVSVSRLPDHVTGFIFGPAGFLWLAVAVVGMVLQAAGWTMWLRGDSRNPMLLMMGSAGAVIMLVGTAVLREIVRAAQVGQESSGSGMIAASEVEGFGVFLLFAVINTGLIVLCVRVVWSQRHRES